LIAEQSEVAKHSLAQSNKLVGCNRHQPTDIKSKYSTKDFGMFLLLLLMSIFIPFLKSSDLSDYLYENEDLIPHKALLGKIQFNVTFNNISVISLDVYMPCLEI
jgi:hypothetical protein